MAASGLGAWGAAELIDPLVTSPQETEARYSDYLDYVEFRNQAMRLHINGVRSWSLRDSDPEMAAELARIENDSGTEGGRILNRAYEREAPR